MNQTGDLGHFILSEYDQMNFLLDLDPRGNSSGALGANSTLVNSFYFYENEQLAMLWLLFVIIVVGNSSVLIGLLLDKSRASRFHYFIKHLAIADLSVGFVNVLTDIIWKLTIEWNAGNVACKVVRYSQAVVTFSSTYLLVALTIDRYEAVRHPMNFFKSWRRAKFLVISAWFLSLFFSIPIIVLYEEKTVQGHIQCWIEFIEPWHWQMYMVTISLTVFFIPAFIIAACYTTIIYTIWSHPNIPDRSLHRKNMSDIAEYVNEDMNCKRMSSRGLIPKAKVKTIKMTLIIVFVFIFCWSPYIIFDLLQVFGYIKRTQTNIAVATFIQSLAPLNSAANPIVYCLFSTYMCRRLSTLPSVQFISKCCSVPKMRNTVKIADASTSTVLSPAPSGRYLNLHHMTGINHQSGTHREPIRGSGEMTLKSQTSELSKKAKAFSVENLLTKENVKTGEDEVLENVISSPTVSISGITVELCCNDLWERFNRIGTEMIVTRAGRRMFPTLKIRLKGLQQWIKYIIYMDIIPVGTTRYRYSYQRSEWTIIGPSSDYTLNSVYVHPESPAAGEIWTLREYVSFDKVKLTNNRRPSMRDQVSLHSMHKYQPRIHVLEVPEGNIQMDPHSILGYIQKNSGRSVTFAFEQTAFITVTAYQNQEITTLKIQSNPFAKGFRETLNAKKEKRETCPQGSVCLKHKFHPPSTLG